MMKKNVIAALFLLSIASCSSHDGSSKKKLNPEILGKWQDGHGCNLELTMLQDNLTLINFSNNKGINLSSVKLKWYKESVFTKFETIESNPILSGSFSDGLILISNQLCQQPLHKADNI